MGREWLTPPPKYCSGVKSSPTKPPSSSPSSTRRPLLPLYALGVRSEYGWGRWKEEDLALRWEGGGRGEERVEPDMGSVERMEWEGEHVVERDREEDCSG